MNFPMGDIVVELRNQLAPIAAEETRLKSTLAELKVHRRKLEAALTVLGGGPQPARPPQSTKTCATRAEVKEIMVELLTANGTLDRADLEALVRDRLREGARSLSGFSLRFREALRESVFIEGEGESVFLALGVSADSAQ